MYLEFFDQLLSSLKELPTPARKARASRKQLKSLPAPNPELQAYLRGMQKNLLGQPDEK